QRSEFWLAEPLIKRCLAIRESNLDPNHLDLADALNDLADLAYGQAKYAQAEPLYRRAVGIWESVFRPHDPRIARALHHMGMLHHSQGNYHQAEPLYSKAIAAHERPPTPQAMQQLVNNLIELADSYQKNGNIREADVLYKRLVSVQAKVVR